MPYDKYGNHSFTPREKWLIFIIVIVVIGSAIYAGSDGGGYVIPSNEP
jgi:hypothetical protein